MTDQPDRIGAPETILGNPRAFTLIELVIVIALLAILAVMLAPSTAGIWRTVRTQQCANNLKRIGEGVHLRETDEQEELNPLVWRKMIAEYVGDSRCFVCPENTGGGAEIVKAIPLKNLVQFKVIKGYRVSYQVPDKGPYVVKLSGRQYNKAKADNAFTKAFVHRGQFLRAKYEDGTESNANPHWLCLQDYW